MKIVTVVGARPQFIKAATISRAIDNDAANRIHEILVHTGQHYDANLSDIFFQELSIPYPKYNLEISCHNHGAMTGRMIERLEQVLIKEKPDWLLIYGDTNSTLAGAIAASKLRIPIAHVEAGLRSFNMKMPEEINRVIADRLSTLLFCPTETAVRHLHHEGITKGIYQVGDVMYDAMLFYQEQAQRHSQIIDRLGLTAKQFVLTTCHRAENTDNQQRLSEILAAFVEINRELPVVLPLHPRTKKFIHTYGLSHLLDDLVVIEPLGFLDMIALEQAALIILTDSGGIQKEAFFCKVPCITMRDETEWTETVSSGWNRLVNASCQHIVDATFETINQTQARTSDMPYGTGEAAKKILACLLN